MVGSAPEQGQTERKEGFRPHTGPMQPIFGNWDLAPDQIHAGLLLNPLVGQQTRVIGKGIWPGPATRQYLVGQQLLWGLLLLSVWRGCQTPLR